LEKAMSSRRAIKLSDDPSSLLDAAAMRGAANALAAIDAHGNRPGSCESTVGR
jgi:hypothetical protein